jgi:cell division protein ZapA (FtsZ GTPase activity inhibitor)
MTMAETKKFKISILGETIRLNSDESVEHMDSVSEYLDELIRRVNKSGIAPEMSTAERFLFASVLLTDNLLKARADKAVLERRVKEMEIDRQTIKKELDDVLAVQRNAK